VVGSAGIARYITGCRCDHPAVHGKEFCPGRRVLGTGVEKALLDREEALRDLARVARWVDRSAFGQQTDFAQAHQALLIALEKAGRFV
jgi:hypothetical protein